MKKLGLFIFMLCCFSGAYASGFNSFTNTNIKSFTDKGYILSDKFLSFEECNTQKDKYNLEYSSYKRSSCFETEGKFQYFICNLNDSCSLTDVSSSNVQSLGSSSMSGNNGNQSVTNKDKLDKFISKLSSTRETTTPEKFIKTLDSVVSKLEALEKKYSSNATIKNMIVYLNNGVKGLYEESDIDNFFCELTGTCNQVGLNNNTNTSTNNTSSNNENSLNNTNTNTCGSGKKQLGSVCVTDTYLVNPNGNYTIGQGACASHTGNDVAYDGKVYKNGINGMTHGIGMTLNKCIEACDIGNINIGGNGANCFYEGKIIRNGKNGEIINISTTGGNTGGSTNTSNNSSFKVSATNSNSSIKVDYNIPASTGYKSCAITAGISQDMISISNGSITVGNGSTSSLGSSESGFAGSRHFSGDSNYLNIYCAKTANAKWTDMEKIIPSITLNSLLNSPITSISTSQIPGNISPSIPNITADKTSGKAGDTINFTWNSNGGTNCFWSNNGTRGENLTGNSGVIPAKDIQAGNYSITVTCDFNRSKKTSAPVSINISSGGTTQQPVQQPTTAPKTCAAGSQPVPSPNNSQTCSFSWPSRTAGQSYNGGGTNRGTISGTCSANGEWINVVVNCPNK